MEALVPLLSKFNDIAVLIPVLGCVGMGYLHVVWRREEREDRRTSMEALGKITEALNGVKTALAAATGKVIT